MTTMEVREEILKAWNFIIICKILLLGCMFLEKMI